MTDPHPICAYPGCDDPVAARWANGHWPKYCRAHSNMAKALRFGPHPKQRGADRRRNAVSERNSSEVMRTANQGEEFYPTRQAPVSRTVPDVLDRSVIIRPDR